MSVALNLVTLRVLKHELRTPINHIIGYSEMVIEDLADGADTAARGAMQGVLAAGQELLTLVNSELHPAASPDAPVPDEVVVSLRAAVGRRVDRVLVENLADSALAHSVCAGDVRKILDAAARLAEFARTGAIRANE